MANNNLVLAISANGNKVSVKDCNDYLLARDKDKLASFIYDRLYGRYLKPFSYPSNDYTENYKNGFALMTSCCLLIETYVSFINDQFRNTDGQSRKAFGHFFTTEHKFIELASGGLKPNGEIAKKTDGGLPNDFYDNVRCGILHNGEVKNGWTITRNKNAIYFDPLTKVINAVKFSNRLDAVLKNYKESLKKADFDTDPIWLNFKNRLNDLINNS